MKTLYTGAVYVIVIRLRRLCIQILSHQFILILLNTDGLLLTVHNFGPTLLGKVNLIAMAHNFM